MAGRISKAQAGYSEGAPHCGICKYYSEGKEEADGAAEEAGSCKLVMGKIDEDMWCRLFQAKRRKTLAEGGG
jgi:hypothetical protein